jgi:hypothetical protein
MRFRIAAIVILLAGLLSCSGASPTEPAVETPAPVVVTTTPVPEPTETPTRGCSEGNCDP